MHRQWSDVKAVHDDVEAVHDDDEAVHDDVEAVHDDDAMSLTPALVLATLAAGLIALVSI